MGNTASIDHAEIYRNANQNLGRAVATPVCSEVMTMAGMFLRYEDLLASKFQNPEVVKELYMVADVIEMFHLSDENPELPSADDFVGMEDLTGYVLTRKLTWRDSRSPASRREIGLSSSVLKRIPWLKSSVETLASLTLAAESTSGVVIGELDVTEETLRLSDISATSGLLSAMEANVLMAELILSYMTHAPDTVTEATLHLRWLDRQLDHALKDSSSPTTGDEALDVQVRNLSLQVKFLLTKPVGAGLIVPRLQYATYSNLVGTMARIAENYDNEFKQLALFIAQNEVLGTYLLEQNKAFAEKEKAMEVFHSELRQVKKDDLKRAFSKLERLEADMTDMNEEMQQAQRDMEAGLIQYRNRQVARAMFSILGAVFSLATAFFTGGATVGAAVSGAANAVQDVSDVASGLQRVVATLEKLVAAIDFQLVTIRELLEAVGDIQQVTPEVGMPDLPSEAEWAIFENEVEEVAAGMPVEVSEALTWKTKCKNMAALGREMINLATTVVELQHDIKVHDMLQEIAHHQAQRLEAIQPADLRNYQEVAIELESRTTRMLLGLLEILSLQNAALRYQYLLPASAITMESTNRISMSSVWALLLQLDSAAVIGLTDLGFAADHEVTYVVKGIPVALLVDGEDWSIPIVAEDFPSDWSRVRISYLEMKFLKPTADNEGEVAAGLLHQPTTDTGEVYMVLRGEQLLVDAKRGERLKYEAAAPVEYQFAYRLDTEETTESNRPSKDFGRRLFMQMTPFTRWKLRLPRTARENRGLAFPTASAPDATTQIAIRFHVSAIRALV